MRFATDALAADVRELAPEARGVERERGMTTFHVRDEDARVVCSEIARAGFTVRTWRPRVAASSPRAYATASSHIRRW